MCFCLVEIKRFAKISLQGDQVNNCDFNSICCSIHTNDLKNFHFCLKIFFITLSGKVKIDGAAFGNKWGLSSSFEKLTSEGSNARHINIY